MRIWPQQPSRDAPRIDRLRYYRRAYLTNLALTTPLLVAFYVFMPPIFLVLGLLLWLPSALIGLPICELQIRRDCASASARSAACIVNPQRHGSAPTGTTVTGGGFVAAPGLVVEVNSPDPDNNSWDLTVDNPSASVALQAFVQAVCAS